MSLISGETIASMAVRFEKERRSQNKFGGEWISGSFPLMLSVGYFMHFPAFMYKWNRLISKVF